MTVNFAFCIISHHILLKTIIRSDKLSVNPTSKEDGFLKEKTAKKNQSVEKVLQIIEVMANNKTPMRLLDIAEKLSLPASTVLRFLNTLLTFSYVIQDPETLKYRLSMKFCQIGNLVSSQFSIRDIARPFLLDLSEKCQESTCLAIEQDMMVVYIDVVDGPDSMVRTMQRIGKNAPLHSTGVGKLMLLDYDDKKLDRLVSEKGLDALTAHTITTKKALLSELSKIEVQGYAQDDEECEIGAKCIAAPIKDFTGKTVACISVSGPVSRMTSQKLDFIKVHIKNAAAEISRQLGHKDK